MNRVAVVLAGALLLAVSAPAQESQNGEKVRSFTFTHEGPVSPGMNMMFQQRVPAGEIELFSAESASAGEVVTASPYTATAVTETTQVLADGNRIVSKSSAFVARDSQGRTRKETTLSRIGTEQMDRAKLIFISDPTTHTQYILTPGDSTKVIKSQATWTTGPTIIDLHGSMGEMHKRMIADQKMKIAATQGVRVESEEGAKEVHNEDLGTQTIEGVSAEGKRETITIPAGQIGNERPIEIVSETWFSPDLHTMVVRKHSDPRVGETVFRLTDIKRIEPDAALFQPPPGTKMKVEPLLELRREGPAKE